MGVPRSASTSAAAGRTHVLVLNAWRFVDHCHILRQGKPWYRSARAASTATRDLTPDPSGPGALDVRRVACVALSQHSPACARRRGRACRKPVFDFADGGAEDEVTLRRNEDAFRRWSFLPRPLEGAATRDQSVDLFGQTLSLPVLIGPTGLGGPVLAARRDRVGAGGRRRFHRLLPEPRLGVLDRGPGRAAPRTALDAGVHLPRSRLHARADAARARRRLPGAGADDRQSAARQARARPRQRLLDSAALLGAGSGWRWRRSGAGRGRCAASCAR